MLGGINAASFPTVLLTTRSAVPITGNTAPPNTPYMINFSGAMSVVVNTCRTPDVLLPMGKYEVGQYFKGRGSTTPINLAQMFRYDMLSSGVGNFIMPFQARYIQTANAVTPGPSNSKLTFTVGYY